MITETAVDQPMTLRSYRPCGREELVLCLYCLGSDFEFSRLPCQICRQPSAPSGFCSACKLRGCDTCMFRGVPQTTSLCHFYKMDAVPSNVRRMRPQYSCRVCSREFHTLAFARQHWMSQEHIDALTSAFATDRFCCAGDTGACAGTLWTSYTAILASPRRWRHSITPFVVCETCGGFTHRAS